MGNVIVRPPGESPTTDPAAAPSVEIPVPEIITCPTNFSAAASNPNFCLANCPPGFTPTSTTGAFQIHRCVSDVQQNVSYIRPGIDINALAGAQTNVEQLNLARAQEATARMRAMEAEGQNSSLVEQARQSAAAAARAAEEQRVREVQGATSGAETASAAESVISAQHSQFNQSSRLIQETKNKLQLKRPPVQPSSEISEEQQKIRSIIQTNALFIQIVLFLILLCAISYLVLPQEIANIASLIILGSAMIYRIFFVQ
jgi:hypothetical protein